MINLVKKDNLNMSILETDFDVFADIVNTFSSESIKKECLIDLDDYILPDYFKNNITIVVQTNKMLIGYIMLEFVNKANSSCANIIKLYVMDSFKNKNMESLLIEGVIYIAGEVGCRNVTAVVDEHDDEYLSYYQQIGFYEIGINEEGTLLSINVSTAVSLRKLNDKFRDIAKNSIDYKELKLVKKISSGRSGNIYLTGDGRILKMFTSTSFTYIKDREETIKEIIKLDIPEIVKPKELVYYDGVFVGYMMEYLPDGSSLWQNIDKYKFEKKLDKLRTLENVMKELHKRKIYICDLNPDNIFFDSNDNIRLIDCDSFVVKENALNNNVSDKFKDPLNLVVGVNTDLYAFAITALEVLVGTRIKDNADMDYIQKFYNKNKNKLPTSLKDYFELTFTGKERYYLTDYYEKYINDMYNYEGEPLPDSSKSGKVSTVILSIMMVIVTILCYLVLMKMK